MVASLALTMLMGLNPQAPAPFTLKLWPNGAPGYESRKDEPEQAKDWWVKNIHNPSMTVFLPPKEKATGCAILIAPGGGHNQLVFPPEGIEPAQYLQSIGVAAIALKYRLAREPGSPYKLGVEPRDDAYRALRLIRSHASEWGIDPNRVGFLGFSAGGEVVNWVAYGSGAGDSNAKDAVDQLNGKPNFQMQVYPGPLGIPETVPADAPPLFLLVANDDDHTPFVLDLLTKYRAAERPVECHILASGGHGFNMGNRSKLVSVQTWRQRLVDWLQDSGYLR